MAEPRLHTLLAVVVIAIGVVVAIALRYISAPYGRHGREGWGPTAPAWLGWMVMESPAALGFLYVYVQGRHANELISLVFAGLWLTHYGYRSFIYPLGLAKGKRIPITVMGMALAFNFLNAYLNARWISHLGDYSGSWMLDPRLWIGVLLFMGGLLVNRRADARLIALKRRGEGYQVPRGGLFEYVVSPNYLGEIVQWFGWALATWSISGLAFALFTSANLAPRARTHLDWYREKFPDFPAERRALIPFVW